MARSRAVARLAHQRQGAVAHAVGDLWQDVVTAHLQEGVRLGLLAWWARTQPDLVPVGGGLFRAVGKGLADYTAQRAQSGRAVAIEAKSRADGRLAYDEISPLQLAHLDACAEHGGDAFLLVEFRLPDAAPLRFAIPWSLVPWRKVRTAPALYYDEVQGFHLLTSPCFLLSRHLGGTGR